MTLGIVRHPVPRHGHPQTNRVGLRSLGEHPHYRIPVWRRLLSNLGTVNGTRENTRQLLADGEAVLVFPGGGREVARRR